MYMIVYHSCTTFIFSLQPSLMLSFHLFFSILLSLTVSASSSLLPYLYAKHITLSLCVCMRGWAKKETKQNPDCCDIGMTYEAEYEARRGHGMSLS